MDDDEVRLSGAAMLHNIEAFTELVGRDVVRRGVATLDPDRRAEYDALVPVAWIRATTADAVYSAIAEEAGRDLFEIYPEVVRRGTNASLRKALRWLMTLTSDAALVRHAPQAYAKGHQGGVLTSTLVGPGHAVLELAGWPHVSELRLLGIGCTMATVLEVAGRKHVEVTRERTDDGARFIVRWQT
jgi:hypothetical protein